VGPTTPEELEWKISKPSALTLSFQPAALLAQTHRHLDAVEDSREKLLKPIFVSFQTSDQKPFKRWLCDECEYMHQKERLT
jgi:ribosomal protein L44E